MLGWLDAKSLVYGKTRLSGWPRAGKVELDGGSIA